MSKKKPVLCARLSALAKENFYQEYPESSFMITLYWNEHENKIFYSDERGTSDHPWPGEYTLKNLDLERELRILFQESSYKIVSMGQVHFESVDYLDLFA